MLSLKHITKSFGDTVAVNDISFEIKPGEVVGFLGPNGAGKTTTMRMIAGVLEQDSGTIELNNISTRKDPVALKQRLGYMPENNPLYDDMLVSEYLAFAAQLKFDRKDRDQQKKAVDKAVKETGIEEVYHRPISDLSKGYKQRVGLAQAIMHTPELLILDEPTEGLDPNQRVSIRDLIKNLGGNRTVLLSTHVLQEVTATCDRVIIINNGAIVADSTTQELIHNAQGQQRITIEAEGLDDARTLESVEGVSKVVSHKKHGSRMMCELSAASSQDPRGSIFDLAKKQGWRIWDMHLESVSLEDVFRELTQ